MPDRKFKLPTIHLVRRESAEWYMFLTLLCFAASVTLTRLFLSLTGYPQLTTGSLHIAHVLWGGLLLYIGALLPLLFSNRGIYSLASILAGIGVGLFIDEVGKFITRTNNYFFPIAAPIIYIFFLLSIIILLQFRRSVYAPKYAQLARALSEIQESLNEKAGAEEWDQIKSDLNSVIEKPPSPGHAELAQALLKFVEAEPAPLPFRRRLHFRPPLKLKQWAFRLLPDRRLRDLLIVGLLGIGLLMWKNPLSVLLSHWFGGNVAVFLSSLRLGREVASIGASGWFEARLVLEVVVGLLLILAAAMLLSKRYRQGTVIGIVGLFISLTTVDLLLFYFEQFSTILTTSFQFLLLIGLYYYRSRLETRKSSAEDVAVT
jgi:hypothetical protein